MQNKKNNWLPHAMAMYKSLGGEPPLYPQKYCLKALNLWKY